MHQLPLLAGNSDLVGGYPLSDLIYPPSFSKRFTSKNMMKFWTNFARLEFLDFINSIEWKQYPSSSYQSEYIILDKRKNLKMASDNISFKSLTNELQNDNRLSDLEKCVVLLQIFTFVGDDVYDQNMTNYSGKCSREESTNFLIDNASYIEY